MAGTILLALAGAAVSGVLVANHDGGWRTANYSGGWSAQLCGGWTTPAGACDAAVSSRWGSFDHPFGDRTVVIPTSLIGAAYFISLALWLGIAGLPTAGQRWAWRLLLLLLAAGMLVSILLTLEMAYRLAVWCRLCVAVHVVNTLIVALVFARWRCARREAPALRPAGPVALAEIELLGERLRRRLSFTAAWVILGAVGSAWLYFDALTYARQQWRRHAALKGVLDRLQSDPQRMMREFEAQPAIDGLAAAAPTEPANIDIFTDLDSGAGACFARRWNDWFGVALAADARVRLRHYNGGTVPAGTAAPASLAAEAARVEGGAKAFACMHNILLRTRREGIHRNFAALAEECGLPADRFLESMSQAAVRRAVGEDQALAGRLGVTRTPAAFVYGRAVPDFCLTSRTFWETVVQPSRTEPPSAATVASVK
ncbi:MAG: hypothetical protein HY763_12365 [Planctomycetes bacterium]|nr:hypothetical protein [Planctomycetota bacterium]